MTRINAGIPPEYLLDSHLAAEIKEINQLAGQFRKSMESGKFEVVQKFTLNTGHVRFFYDKGKYLHLRFNDLKEEAIRRNFNIEAEFNNEWEKYPKLYNDWYVEPHAYKLICDRIAERVTEKPHIYRYKGKLLGSRLKQYLEILSSVANPKNDILVRRVIHKEDRIVIKLHLKTTALRVIDGCFKETSRIRIRAYPFIEGIWKKGSKVFVRNSYYGEGRLQTMNVAYTNKETLCPPTKTKTIWK